MRAVRCQQAAQLVNRLLLEGTELERDAESHDGVPDLPMLGSQMLNLQAMSLGGHAEEIALFGVLMVEQVFLEIGPVSAKLRCRSSCFERSSELLEQQLVVFVIAKKLRLYVHCVAPNLGQSIGTTAP